MHTIGSSKGILILYIVGDVVASSCLEILLVMYVFNKLFRRSSPVQSSCLEQLLLLIHFNFKKRGRQRNMPSASPAG